MSISIKEYFALAGSGFSNADAKIIGPVLTELQTEGVVTPEGLVSAARSTNSPLHSYFEWDDVKAAGFYRQGQAATMLQSIRVRFTSNAKEYATRAHKVEVAPRAPQLAAVHVQRDARDDLQDMASMAVRDLDAWCLKFGPQIVAFGKFAEVFNVVRNQIGEFREDFEACNISGPFRRMMSEFFAWHEEFLVGASAARLYGEHLRYMQEAIADAKAEFVRSGYEIERVRDDAA